MKKTALPVNKPASASAYLLNDLLPPDSRASHSWEDAVMIRSELEADSEPLPVAFGQPEKIQIKIRVIKVKLSPENAASRRWHARKAAERKKAGLNWLGKPYKNKRHTRPLVHPDLPPKLYLDHAAYVAAWRAKRKSSK